MPVKKLLTLFALYILINCKGPDCPHYGYTSQFNYQVSYNAITPSGIKVDTSGQLIRLDTIDVLTNEVETCLEKNFGSPPHIPQEVRNASYCVVSDFNLPCDRDCFSVKVPDDWVMSCDGSQQLLPTEAPQELCDAKGLTANPDCPCRWRAGIQNNNIIVTTPSLYLYKDPLIRIITGCNNPWAHTRLAECAQPTVPPL